MANLHLTLLDRAGHTARFFRRQHRQADRNSRKPACALMALRSLTAGSWHALPCAADSVVADAAKKGDRAAVESLIATHKDRQRAAG